MTPDQHLVQAVADVPDKNGNTMLYESDAIRVLDAIPDGWAKIDGRWVRLREAKAIDGCGGSTHDDPAWDRPLSTVYEVT